MRNIEEVRAVENPTGIIRKTMGCSKSAMMCHFDMKKGTVIPLHNHPAEQIGYVISGRVKFNLAGGDGFIAESGCGYEFESMEYHGAEILEDSEVIECFSPVRDEYR